MENGTMAVQNATAVGTKVDVTSVAVGVSQIGIGIIFIPLQLITAYLIRNDKEMRNPTYQFIIVLSIADALELVCISLYTGIVVVSGVEQYEWMERAVGYMAGVNWLVSCVMLVLVAYSRWIAITRPELTHVIFKKNVMLLAQILPWVIFSSYYFYPELFKKVGTFIPAYHLWAIVGSTRVGQVAQWFNFAFSSSCSAMEATFNVLSLFYVHKLRKSISPMVSTDANQRREIKLLMQCVIIGFVFTLSEILFTIALFTNANIVFALALALWTLNHIVNPIVYLVMNTRFRKHFLALVSMGKCHGGEENTTRVAKVTGE